MGSDTPNTVLGVIIAVLGVIGSVTVARISRPHDPDEHGAPRAELTTIASLAQEMVRLQKRVSELEFAQTAQQEHSRLQDLTIGALRRYTLLLETALRRLGADVPEPEPGDAPLIRLP